MSDRSDQLDREARELAGAIESPALASDAMAMRAMDAMEDMKREVLGFFKNRIASISRAEHIKELIYHQFESEIEGGELSFDQKISLLMRLDRDNNDLADSIISMFRPSGNSGGSLLTDVMRPGEDKSDIARAFANYTPEELRKIDATMRVIRDIVESGKTVDVEDVKKEL